MGCYIGIKSPMGAIAKMAGPMTVLNDMPIVTEEDRQMIDRMTTRMFEHTDMFSNTPSCLCGALRRGDLIGQTCHSCGTKVTETFGEPLDSMVYIRAPEGVEDLILPGVLQMLLLRTTDAHFQYVRWVIDPKYNPNRSNHSYIAQELISMGLQRGYNYFVKNFDDVMDKICTYIWRKRAGGKRAFNPNDISSVALAKLMQVIKYERHQLFSKFLPLPNRVMLTMETTSSGTYMNKCVPLITDVIRSMRGIDTPISEKSPRVKENQTATALIRLANYYYKIYEEDLGGKFGAFRKHIFGARVDYSMRCVISSITVPHQYDELELPWRASVAMFSIHLMNKLFKRGMIMREVFETIYAASYMPTQLIKDLFQELINESRDGCIYVYFNRNPSLKRGSCQRFRVKCIKDDPEDVTIGLPVLDTSPFNADYDGDAMNLYLAADNFIADAFARLDPHLNLPDDNAPLSFSALANLPRPAICTFSNWYMDEEPLNQATAETQAFLQRMMSGQLTRSPNA